MARRPPPNIQPVELLPPARRIVRVVITSPKGGCGKTNTTRNLAAAAVHDGFSVSTADLDKQATLTRWARRRPGSVPGIVHYQVAWSDADALTTADGIDPCDVLFIDTPPSVEEHPVEMRRLLASADLILVPCHATFDDIESAVPFLQMLRQGGAKPVSVLNFSKPRQNVGAEKAMLLEAAELCPVELGERADYHRAGSKGLGLADVAGHAGAGEVKALWTFAKQRLGITAPPVATQTSEAPHVDAA